MALWKWTAAIAVAVLMGGRAYAAPPLEAYGRLPALDLVTISPDGGKLAYVAEVNGQRLFMVSAVGDNKPLAILKVGAVKLRALSWAGNGTVILTMSTASEIADVEGPKKEWWTAETFDIATRKWQRIQVGSAGAIDGISLNSAPVAQMNIVYSPPIARPINGHEVVFFEAPYFETHTSIPGLYAKDLDAQMSRLVEKSPFTTGWIIDGDGKAVAKTGYDENSKDWFLKVLRDGSWSQALKVDARLDPPQAVGLSSDGSSVIVASQEEGLVEFTAVDLKTGAVTPVSTADYRFDRMVADDEDGRLLAGENLRAKHEYKFFKESDQAVWDRIVRTFPEADVEFLGWSDDRNRVVIRVLSPTYGYVDLIVDLAAKRADPIGYPYPLQPGDVASVSAITYSAGDGLKLPAYLTLPNNRDPKNLPLVVLPHGGPQSRDLPGFDWLAQALSSHGYAVLQPQFRGSLGWDVNLFRAGFGEFGRKMQTDLSDGVRALAAKGTIDPKRVCIVGASYGGYAALAGATLDPGVYRCAVSFAGISDIRQLLSYFHAENRDSSFNIRFWDRYLGTKSPDDPALDKISPANLANRVTIPILLIHGRDDTVVPFAQSKEMAEALKQAGKPVQLVELKGEDHWLSRSDTRLEMLKATVQFLEANNPPG